MIISNYTKLQRTRNALLVGCALISSAFLISTFAALTLHQAPKDFINDLLNNHDVRLCSGLVGSYYLYKSLKYILTDQILMDDFKEDEPDATASRDWDVDEALDTTKSIDSENGKKCICFETANNQCTCC